MSAGLVEMGGFMRRIAQMGRVARNMPVNWSDALRTPGF
ncbi:hypothetical protein SCH4B_1258 [Ruegeria sp. TrichCH4B]|nr:hypothetical protein SCH4B_1258 [Ruegeria sp. TrichCH4B]